MVDFNRLDVSAKELVWEGPEACLERFAGRPARAGHRHRLGHHHPDRLGRQGARVDGPAPYLVNIEPHAYHDTGLARTLWYRQVALDYRHNLPVLTVLVLLCKKANSPSLTGTYERQLPDGWPTNRYNYRVVRLWQEDPEPYLAGGVNLVPLAPLTNVAEESLPDLMRRMAERINPEPPWRAEKFWIAAMFLMTLRYEPVFAKQLVDGVYNMRESAMYQLILQEGRDEGRVGEAQRLLLRLGGIRFGPPDEATRAAVEAIGDLDRLERMSDRILDTSIHDWNGLLDTP